jgi:hypothetical protein
VKEFPMSQTTDQSNAPELSNPDFQHVLEALLAAYQPVIEQQLKPGKESAAASKGGAKRSS